MKNIEVSSRNFIGGLVLSFLLGIGFAQTVVKALLRDHIPDGIYAPLVMSDGASFQINVTNSSNEGKTFTTWLREDRSSWAKTETGMIGQTVFTKMTIDCSTETVKVLEQRAFGPNMEFVGIAEGANVAQEPKSLVGMVGLLSICTAELVDEHTSKHQTEDSLTVPETVIKPPVHTPGKHEA